jgi:hypothetical protein
MISIRKLIHDKDFASDIVIERTSEGHFEKAQYVSAKTIITVKGIMINPKSSKEIDQTAQGDRATGYVKIYVDENTPLYVTRKRNEMRNNISDVIIDNYGTDYEVRYRITDIFDRSQWGFRYAEAVREGAI